MKKLIGLMAGVALLAAASCGKDDDNDGGTQPINCATFTTTFSANVLPLMTNSCAKSGCHAAGSANGPGALTTYAQINASKSSIRAVVASGQMPKDATFTAAQKATITCWIDGGAPNN